MGEECVQVVPVRPVARVAPPASLTSQVLAEYARAGAVTTMSPLLCFCAVGALGVCGVVSTESVLDQVEYPALFLARTR